MDRIIELDGKEFLICQVLDVNGIHYIYAVSTSEDIYTLLVETTENGEKYVESVTDEKVLNEIMSIIVRKNI